MLLRLSADSNNVVLDTANSTLFSHGYCCLSLHGCHMYAFAIVSRVARKLPGGSAPGFYTRGVGCTK